MKKIFFCLLAVINFTAFAQTPKYLISEEIKLKKKYGIPSIIHSDNTGTYLATHVSKVTTTLFLIPITGKMGSEILIKLNDKLEKVFMID